MGQTEVQERRDGRSSARESFARLARYLPSFVSMPKIRHTEIEQRIRMSILKEIFI